jgi:WD40 repeat protein/serine/threonine protein kinase
MQPRPSLPQSPDVPHAVAARTTPNDPDCTTDYQPVQGSTPLPEVPGYEIVRELGRGGMGVAYLARHLGLKRSVALKMLLHAQVVGSTAAARFLAEAETLAALRHPNIVPIYDRGEHNGLSYFAMEYCDGGSLADRITESPLLPDQAARTVEQLARAVALAHDRGILHRDLKPGNVLFSDDGTPKISDFGLAKRLDSTDMERLTQTGAVIGTPSYMAPEQAEGKPAGISADVYALGAILYRLLAGRPPFVAASTTSTLQLVVKADPVSPRQLNPAVPRDLETICLKCLSKTAEHRYATATALADDLGRYLRHEPILARPASRLERTWKWAKRNPSRAAFVTASILLLVTVAGASTLLALQQHNYNRDLLKEQEATERHLRASQRGEAQKALDHGISLCEQGDIGGGLFAMIAGLEPAAAAGAGDVEEAIRFNLAAWQRETWHLRDIRMGPDANHVSTVRPSPDGQSLAVALSNNTVEIWPLDDRPATVPPLVHNAPVAAMEFSADGHWLMTQTRQAVQLWDATTGQSVGPALAHLPVVSHAAISVDGRFIASAGADRTIQVWDRGRPAEAPIVIKQKHQWSVLAFDPAGQRLLASEAGLLRLLDVRTGEAIGNGMNHDSTVFSAGFSADGRWIVAGTGGSTKSNGGKVYLWNAEDRKLLFETHVPGGIVEQVTFRPDGRVFSVRTNEGAIHLRRAPNGEAIACPLIHAGALTSLAFSPDGTVLTTGGSNGQVRFWDAERGLPKGVILSHQSAVRWCGFAPTADGPLISVDGAVRIWNATEGLQRGPATIGTADVFAQAFTGDGSRLLAGCSDGFLRVRDAKSGRQLSQTVAHSTSPAYALAIHPNGRLVVTAGWDGFARIWDLSTWTTTATLAGHNGPVMSVAISPDGRTILTGGSDRTARLWELETGRPIGTPLSHGGSVTCVAFRPDSTIAITGCQDKKARLWRVATRELIGTPLNHDGPVEAVALSNDGRFAVTAGYDKLVRLWESETGEPAGTIALDGGFCKSIALSPDGRYALFGSDQPVVKLRSFPSGERNGSAIRHHDWVRAVAFAPDGRTVVTASSDTTARRWHVPTGVPVGPALPHTRKLFHATFSPTGDVFATGGFHGTSAIWSAPGPIEGSITELRQWAERITGLVLNENSPSAMDIKAWHERRTVVTGNSR